MVVGSLSSHDTPACVSPLPQHTWQLQLQIVIHLSLYFMGSGGKTLCLHLSPFYLKKYLVDKRYPMHTCCMVETLGRSPDGQVGSGWVRGGIIAHFGFGLSESCFLNFKVSFGYNKQSRAEHLSLNRIQERQKSRAPVTNFIHFVCSKWLLKNQSNTEDS